MKVDTHCTEGPAGSSHYRPMFCTTTLHGGWQRFTRSTYRDRDVRGKIKRTRGSRESSIVRGTGLIGTANPNCACELSKMEANGPKFCSSMEANGPIFEMGKPALRERAGRDYVVECL